MIHLGDCIEVMRALEAGSVQTCVTSPPYFGLRDYGLPPRDWDPLVYSTLGGEIAVPAMRCCLGLEDSVEAYIGHIVEVMREVHRLLADDGTLWLNLGDSYAGTGGQGPQTGEVFKGRHRQRESVSTAARVRGPGLKQKDLVGVPWRP